LVSSSAPQDVPPPDRRSAVSALFQFHLDTGVRVALGLGSLGIVGFIILVEAQPEPGSFLAAAARDVAGGTGLGTFRLLLALTALGSAFVAARRAVLGTRGWERSLPAGPVEQRRAFLLALLPAQVLVALLWAALWVGGAVIGTPVRIASLAAVPWVVAAAGAAATPFARIWPRAVAWGALVLAAGGSWPGLAVATVLLAAVERWGGGLALGRGRGRRPGRREPPRFMVALLARRAVGWRGLVTPVIALLPVAFAGLVLRNNAVLSPTEAAVAVRGGGAAGMAWAVAGIAGRLAERRPPWVWSRSLPWAARTRIRHDVEFLGLCTVPALVGAFALRPAAAWPLAGAALYLASRGAGAVRRSTDSASGLGWRWPVEAGGVVLAAAASAWTGLVLAALVPLAFRGAERSEQRLRVSLLRERRYSAAGDPTT